jgi:hypothetical protein
MPNFIDEVALALLYPVVGLFLLYWVIRLAVRHGVVDAEESRRRVS